MPVAKNTSGSSKSSLMAAGVAPTRTCFAGDQVVFKTIKHNDKTRGRKT
jgi:hypothetical protein